MIRNVLGTRRRTGALFALLLAATAFTGCGDDDSTADQPDGGDDSATVDPTSDSPGDASSEGSGPTGGGAELTADDGWLELHDLDIPGPGQGVLSIEGQVIDLDIECGEGILASADWMLFNFVANGTGVSADGREVEVEVKRSIVSVDEAATGYGPQESGEIRVSIDLADSALSHSSVLVSPADADPDGSMLPVVRIDETGSFTVVEDVPAMSMHGEALSGPLELAGSCPDAWSA